MIFGNNKPQQVYIQVNSLNLWVCRPEPTSVPCPHERATVRLCNELSQPNSQVVTISYIINRWASKNSNVIQCKEIFVKSITKGGRKY